MAKEFPTLRFKLKDQPELEAALNALGAAIMRFNRGDAFFNTRYIKSRTEEGRIGFDWMPDKDQESNIKPLTLIQGSTEGKIQVVPGYVNSLMPTLGGTELDASPAPELTVTANTWVWIKVVGVFGSPDTYTVTIETSTSTSPPEPEAISGTSFTGFFPIGHIADYAAGPPVSYAIENEHDGGNLIVRSMGNSILWGAV